MTAPILDNCVICGKKARRPGERLCHYHDIQYLISIGADWMRERLKEENARLARPYKRRKIKPSVTRIGL